MGYYWRGMYPDARGISTTVPAVPAILDLQDPVTVSPAMQNVILRARAAGAVGNSLEVRFVVGTLSDFGELEEFADQVTIKFNDGDRVGDIVSLINTHSELIEAVGSWNPSDMLVDGENQFDFTPLTGGVDEVVGPRAAFWGPHYPDWASTAIVFRPASTPDGVASFALLEGAATVHLRWRTDVFKAYDGTEKRAALLDDPEQTYDGMAFLIGDNAVAVRTQLARFAALGSEFQLALPYEELTIIGDGSAGLVVPVTGTAEADWANVGQRVAVLDHDGNAVQGVIQVVGNDTLELDVVAGDVGRPGSRIMPLVNVALAPTQGFSRYPIARSPTADGARPVETWSISALGTTSGFVRAPQVAQLPLVDLVNTFDMQGIILSAVTPGISVAMAFEAHDGIGINIGVAPDEEGNLVFNVTAENGTTIGELVAALNATGLLTVGGTWEGDTLIGGSDDFELANFTGGDAGGPAELGRGAVVAEHASRPIFDRGVDVEGTAPDSMQAMNEIVEGLGAFPYSVGTATKPDWGRSLAMVSAPPSEWQWFKKFVSTVRGRQRAFWLPTFREDLLAVGDGPGGGTTGQVTIDNDVGDYTFWATDRANVMIVQGEETYYATITGATDNHDGTTTLDLDTGGPTIPPAAPVEMISWLELCRLESDDLTVEFRGANFTVKTAARVVQR